MAKLKELGWSNSVTEGRWIQDPLVPGVRYRVAFNNKHNPRFKKALLERLDEFNSSDDEGRERITKELYAEAILTDWEGIDDLREVTPENALELLMNDRVWGIVEDASIKGAEYLEKFEDQAGES